MTANRASVPAPTGPDIFLLHAEADGPFVRNLLIPELGLEGDRVLLSSALPVGMTVVEALESGVATSRVTVVVVSPGFLHDEWARFGEVLAGYHAARGGRLVPLVVADCALPLRLDFRVKLDCRDPGRRAGEIARLRTLLELPPPQEREVPCPYPGMRPYTAENAALFCGRDRDVEGLVGRIAAGLRELYIVGPSGSGKSSLLRSGVVPRLERAGDAVVGEPFAVHVVRPGDAPGERLAAVVSSAVSQPERTLVVIDQLEEIFTLAGPAGRSDFFRRLDELRAAPSCHLAFALRADFQGALMQSDLWAHVRRSYRHEVDPLRGDDLREAITAPARRVGVDLEPALLDRLLADAANEPGSLPLIQEALVHLWGKRERNLLTAAQYAALGGTSASGLAVALSHRADASFTALDDLGQAIARRVFLRLVSFGEGRADTRRQQPLSALRSADDRERLPATLRHLTDARLLTADGDEHSGEVRLDLAHETLIAAWSRLRDWIATNRAAEQRRRHLEAVAAEWAHRAGAGRGDVGLLEDAELVELDGWLTVDVRRHVGVSDEVEAFVAASRAAVAARIAEREARAAADALRERQKRRWARFALVTLATAVAGVSTLAVIASRSAREARDEKREAQRQLARNYVAQADALLVGGHGAQALPYVVAARELGADDLPLRALFRWASQAVPLMSVAHGASVSRVAWSPDGARLATGGARTVRVWDAHTGQAVSPPFEHGDVVTDIAWSPDGTRLASASWDATARVWDARTGKVVFPPLAHANRVNAVAWKPDGARLATASDDHTARIWDSHTGRPESPPLEHPDGVLQIAWSRDGTRVAVATAAVEHGARIWNAQTGQAATPECPSAVNALMWSPDGTRLATADQEGLRIWDASTGRLASPPLAHGGGFFRVAWSPDGTRLATIGDDAVQIWSSSMAPAAKPSLEYAGAVGTLAWSPNGTLLATGGHGPATRTWGQARGNTAQLWDTRSGEAASPPFEHRDSVWALAWSLDGKRVATGSADGTARVWGIPAAWKKWEAQIDAQVDVPALGDAMTRIEAVAWSPDGTRVAAGSRDGSARLWDARTGKLALPPLRHRGAVSGVQWSRDGAQLATASCCDTAQLWNTGTGQPVSPRFTRDGITGVMAWSPNLTWVVTTARDHTARVWDARTGDPVAPPLAHRDWIRAVVWSPDGTRVATASDDGTARVWTAQTGQPASPPLEHSGGVTAVAWSPDSTRVATVGNSAVQIWDTSTGKAISPPLEHDKRIQAVVFSPDGSRVATASEDTTARVWDAHNGHAISPPLQHVAGVWRVVFSPDGSRVATASEDSTVRVWDARNGHAVSPPLLHRALVSAVTWSPDGTRLVTASSNVVTVWDVSWNIGDLDEWRAMLDRCPYQLNSDGAVVARSPEPR